MCPAQREQRFHAGLHACCSLQIAVKVSSGCALAVVSCTDGPEEACRPACLLQLTKRDQQSNQLGRFCSAIAWLMSAPHEEGGQLQPADPSIAFNTPSTPSKCVPDAENWPLQPDEPVHVQHVR